MQLASQRSIGGSVTRKTKRYSTFAAMLTLFFVATGLVATSRAPNLRPQPNPSGNAQSFSTAGYVDLGSAFFQNLGTNGRTCGTCHQESDGWTITPPHVQARFDASAGDDPIFRTNDGANCPTADVGTLEARRTAYSMLLNKGLIRVSMGVPAGAEFTIESIDDPYHCATPGALALFRRPLPATNLRFLSAVMWDGRESAAGRSLQDNLISQARDATTGHAQGLAPNDAQLAAIVQFEMDLATSQISDHSAGLLNAQGGKGGAVPLSKQEFYIGINDPLGLNPTGAPFDSDVFTLYSAWENLDSSGKTPYTDARLSVARGERIFNTRPIAISGVSGLNDELGVQTIMGTCTTCHDSPNVGNHSVPAPLDIGVVDESRRTPDMPLYTLKCTATGQEYKVTDPGRALITGRCKDIGRFKGPVLRGLAARAPYFHNGMAADLRQAVDFYDERFNLGLSEQEKQDLVAFLQTL